MTLPERIALKMASTLGNRSAREWATMLDCRPHNVYGAARAFGLKDRIELAPPPMAGLLPTIQPKSYRGREVRVGPPLMRLAGIGGEVVRYRIVRAGDVVEADGVLLMKGT